MSQLLLINESCEIMKFNVAKRNALQTPLIADNFCGVYLKADKQKFRPLRNEFNLAQTSLRKLTTHPEASELDSLLEENSLNWGELALSLNDVFTHTTRDIELSGWMLAAQIIIDPSLSGAKEMALWLQELVSQHWDTLQPVLPENKIKSDDPNEKNKEINAFKIKAFVQLVGESEESGLLHAPLLMVPLIGDLDYARYQSAEHKGNLAELRSEYHQQALSDRTRVVALIDNLTEIKKSVGMIEQNIIEICKQSQLSPIGFKFVIDLIGKMLTAIEFISGLKAKLEKTNDDIPQIDAAGVVPDIESENDVSHVELTNKASQQAHINHVSFGSLAETQGCNRDQAFHQLREIADYFRKVEPHSPVAYLLEKAIRWGYMPLPELMSELLLNQTDTINRVFNLTGLDEEGKIALPEVAKKVYAEPISRPVVNVASFKKETSVDAAVANESREIMTDKSTSNVIHTENVNRNVVQKAETNSSSSNSLSW